MCKCDCDRERVCSIMHNYVVFRVMKPGGQETIFGTLTSGERLNKCAYVIYATESEKNYYSFFGLVYDQMDSSH